MAKSKKNTRQIIRRNKSKSGAAPMVRSGLALDQAGLSYAKLISDPCNGPLVSGPFADGKGGIVSRFEVDQLFNTGGTETACYFAFVPGNGFGYASSTALTSETTTITPTAAASYSAGNGFLAANCGQARALSACLQVYYPGSESSRSGIVSLGSISVDAAVIGSTPNVQKIRTVSQITERTPTVMAEIKWRPTTTDTQWYNPKAPPSANVDVAGMTALVVTAAGLPAGTGLRVRCVYVVEWLPTMSSGFVSPMYSVPGSKYTLRDVLEYLDRTGHWMYNGALTAATTLSSIYRAGKSLNQGVRAVSAVAYGTAKMAPLIGL